MVQITLKLPCKKHVLLTGAGFTHNFGGPLASELWSWIFNNRLIQDNLRLREHLLNELDFESIYFEVMNGRGWSEPEKNILAGAVSEAYLRIDGIVRDWIYNRDSPYPVNEYGLRELINRFSGTTKEPGYVFTLNQDLFIERKHRGDRLVSPGVPYNHRLNEQNQPLSDQDIYQLPTEEVIEREKDRFFTGGSFYYIKLHGSQNWIGSDGNHRMVIGRDKNSQIDREPLLRAYLSAFDQVLRQRECKLAVIGYGFGDEHINNIIVRAVLESGLRVYVISPMSIRDFRDSMADGNKKIIFDALGGYTSCDLLKLYPTDQSQTSFKKDLYKQLFD